MSASIAEFEARAAAAEAKVAELSKALAAGASAEPTENSGTPMHFFPSFPFLSLV